MSRLALALLSLQRLGLQCLCCREVDFQCLMGLLQAPKQAYRAANPWTVYRATNPWTVWLVCGIGEVLAPECPKQPAVSHPDFAARLDGMRMHVHLHDGSTLG